LEGEKMLKKKDLPPCPVATTVRLIGNKWKLLILRDLMSGTRRFGELRKCVSGISQKVLTDNLRDMEDDGILSRKIYAEVPPRVEYKLTDLGNSLKPVIESLEIWGKGYQKKVFSKDGK
jgi:DNA-binding HxlR family transcriptional regulator